MKRFHVFYNIPLISKALEVNKQNLNRLFKETPEVLETSGV